MEYWSRGSSLGDSCSSSKGDIWNWAYQHTLSVVTQQWETKMGRLQGGKLAVFLYLTACKELHNVISFPWRCRGTQCVFLLHRNLFCVSVYVWVWVCHGMECKSKDNLQESGLLLYGSGDLSQVVWLGKSLYPLSHLSSAPISDFLQVFTNLYSESRIVR